MTRPGTGNQAAIVRSVPEPAAVLTKAVVRAAGLLGLNQAVTAQALGVSAATASRMFRGHYQLDPGKKEWELAALLVRVFRSLDSIVGGSEAHARAWISSENHGMGARPIELVTTAEGMVRVLHYLDAERSRI